MAGIAATATGRAWKAASVATTTATREVRGRPWGQRLRYWLNSFRGFAVLDVRGIDDRERA